MIDLIKDKIGRFELGYVFTTSDFYMQVDNLTAVSKILNDFVRTGYLRKLSKGKFYKPRMSKFGELPPDDFQIVKDLLLENNKPTGYVTGYAAFNEFGLTTQVPFALQIGTYDEKKAVSRGVYRISFIKQRNTITKENIPLLKMLDCLRFFKNIPDTTPNQACERLLYLLSQLDENQTSRIKKLSLKYAPQAITLLGAMLETLNPQENTTRLCKEINPITSYQLGISPNILPNQKKWNIR
jgi:hypothetical protein